MTFLASPADIAIYGGAAGGGKSWALLMEPLRHINNPDFGGVIFRRSTVQVRNEGGLWDESMRLYPLAGGSPKETVLQWAWPNPSRPGASGAAMTFAHLEHDSTVLNYQGAQIPYIGFDELTHFTSRQFWYMVSRNRSMSGVRPYIRATCNPDSESWVADFISWWINQDTGLPIIERSGVIRHFVRVGEKLVWADTPEELAEYKNPMTGKPLPSTSMTFVPATLQDNKKLMEADPSYLAKLLSLPPVERERLLGGNWKIRRGDVDFFPLENMLERGMPVPMPTRCDAVYAIMDCAVKIRSDNDGTAVTYFARTKHGGIPLAIVDWDLVQIEGAFLIDWVPSVLTNLERLAKVCGARNGSVGIWIEDAASGSVLLQQCRNKHPARAVDSRLTAMGKDQRALLASPHYHKGDVKITEEAFHKTVTYKESTKNHLISQVTNFRIGDLEAAKRADDLLDTFANGIVIGLGDLNGLGN